MEDNQKSLIILSTALIAVAYHTFVVGKITKKAKKDLLVERMKKKAFVEFILSTNLVGATDESMQKMITDVKFADMVHRTK